MKNKGTFIVIGIIAVGAYLFFRSKDSTLPKAKPNTKPLQIPVPEEQVESAASSNVESAASSNAVQK